MSRSKQAARQRARERELTRQREQARRRRVTIATAAIGAVVLVIALMVVVRVGAGRGTTTAAASGSAPPAVTAALASVASTTFDGVGRGTTSALPVRLPAVPPLTEAGKPLVLYVGAEYCPFCAAQRWSLVVALNRFGKFTGLGASHSSVDDVFPATATLTFHGSGYISDYLSFAGVELAGNVRGANGYEPLQALTPAQSAVLAAYDAPPYVPASSRGAIPFVDFGNHFVMTGSSFDPGTLDGLTHEQIASALADPDSPVARSVLGSANAFTAVLCGLTGGQPAAVCGGGAAHAYPELTDARA